MENNTTLIAVFFGIVEGLTEFLPVSSTGHLIILGKILPISDTFQETFEIAIQAGAMFAVLILYFQRFKQLLNFAGESDGFSGISGCVKLFLGCLPAFIFGFLLHKYIKENLFSPIVVAISLIIGGVVFIFLPENKLQSKSNIKNSLDKISVKDSIIVGCYQVLALCPGVSRSGATIVGGILNGFDKKTAAEFSFFLAVPTLFAAVGYDLYKNYHLIKPSDIQIFLLGTFVSFLSALIAIKAFIEIVSKYSIKIWGVYRILFGLLVLYFFY